MKEELIRQLGIFILIMCSAYIYWGVNDLKYYILEVLRKADGPFYLGFCLYVFVQVYYLVIRFMIL